MFNKINIYVLFSIIIIILSISLFKTCSLNNEYKNSNEELVDNIRNLNDSVLEKKNKIGELFFEKNTLTFDLNTIKTLNKNIELDLKNFKNKDKKNIEKINQIQGEINYLKDSLNHIGILTKIDSTYFYSWVDSSAYKITKGSISFISKTTPYNFKYKLTKDISYIDIILYEKEGKVLAKSNNPNVTFSNINSFEIKKDPIRQKKLGLGFSTGLGLTQKGTPTYYIGVGLNYNLISLF